MTSRRTSLLAVLIIMALAAVMRGWEVTEPEGFTGDEELHVTGARVYLDQGHLDTPNWYHPPLNALTLRASMSVLGDNSLGWRGRNVLLGTLTIGVVMLLAFELFDSYVLALLAATLLAVDPLHIALSRSTFHEVPLAFLLVLHLWTLALHWRGRLPSLLPAGVTLGLILAMKWQFALLPPLAVAVALVRSSHRDEPPTASIVHAITCLVVLPVSLYVVTFVPWLSRGYSLLELGAMQIEAFRVQQALRPEEFEPILASSMAVWAWFVKPVGLAVATEATERGMRYTTLVNSPPVLLLTIPAVAYTFWRGQRDEDPRWWLPGAALLVGYVPLLLMQRPLFIYSLLPLVPLAYLAIAGAAQPLRDWAAAKLGSTRWFDGGVFALTLAWGMLWFPLAARIPVPPHLAGLVFSTLGIPLLAY